MPIAPLTETIDYLETCGLPLSDAGRKTLSALAPVAQRAIEKIIGIQTVQGSFTEFHPASASSGGNENEPLVAGYEVVGGIAIPRTRGLRALSYLNIRRLPVRSITTVWENPSAWVGGDAQGTWPNGMILPPSVYSLDQSEPGMSWSGNLVRGFSTWSTVGRSVKVLFVAGFTPEELCGEYSQIKLAYQLTCANMVQHAMFRSLSVKVGGIMSNVSLEDFSVAIQPYVKDNSSWIQVPREALGLMSDFLNVNRYFGR